MRQRILVIDDDEGIRDILDLILTEEGYDAVAVSETTAALEQIERIPPQLILLDSGLAISAASEFVAAYCARPGQHAPIIVLSAAADISRRAQAVRAAGYLAKPFDLADLLALVSQHLQLGSATPADSSVGSLSTIPAPAPPNAATESISQTE